MNTAPRMSASYESMSDFPSLGAFSIDEESFADLASVVAPQTYAAKSHTQFNVIVKRDDALYKILNVMNTLFSVLAVLLIVSTFVLVFYSLITITEAGEMVTQIKEHNELQNVPRR